MSTYTYDPATDVGKVRLLIGDTVLEEGGIFTDEELTAFLSMEEDDIYRTAALALEAIAVSETLILKAVTVLDLTMDGPAVARSLRETARNYREIAGSEVVFDFAQMALTPANTIELWVKDNWPL